MKLVNPYFLNDLMSPITGLADDDEAVSYYNSLNISSEEQYRSIIREVFIEYFSSLDKQKKDKTKTALSFYLSKQDSDFERVFESCLPPFDPPTDVRDFFVWLWEELFKGESYIISDMESYKIVPDIHEPNRPIKR